MQPKTRGTRRSPSSSNTSPPRRATVVDVRLANVTKRYDGVSALDDLSLSVASGEFMVVVGPSGSGKTTMLRCIAGLDEPDSGDIFIGGRWANDIPVGKRDVQMIFQTLALWPHMRVLDEQKWTNVSFPLRVRGWAVEQVRERVEATISAQRQRLNGTGRLNNSEMGPNEVWDFCPMDDPAKNLIQTAMQRMSLSARGFHRILKVSRTIADLSGSETIEVSHLAEALQYRQAMG